MQFTLIGLALNFDLIGLHDFLDSSTNIAQSDVDTGLLDTRVGGILDSSQQVIINRVECKSESRVDDSACKISTDKVVFNR